MLEAIVQNYNERCAENEQLPDIDDNKLCNIVLKTKGLILKVLECNVVAIAFDCKSL